MITTNVAVSVVWMNQIVSDTIHCLLFRNHPHSFWPGLPDGIRPGAILNDLLFKIAVRSSRLRILVSGLPDAFVTTFNFYRKCPKGDLCFSELMHGRTKLMTAVCPAWAHTYQSVCLGYRPSQLRLWNFRLLRPEHKFGELPTCRSSTWTAGIECDGWRLFTDGGAKQSEGADLAGWCIAAVSPDSEIGILFGLVTCHRCHPAFQGASACTSNTAELSSFAEAIRFCHDVVTRGAWVLIFYDSKHAARLALRVAHAKRNIAHSHAFDTHQLKAGSTEYISVNNVFSHAGNVGDEWADIAASLGTHCFFVRFQKSCALA